MMKLTVNVASVPDRDAVVAEIWAGDRMVAEVTQEAHGLCIETYANPADGSGKLSLDELISALHEAKKKLLG